MERGYISGLMDRDTKGSSKATKDMGKELLITYKMKNMKESGLKIREKEWERFFIRTAANMKVFGRKMKKMVKEKSFKKIPRRESRKSGKKARYPKEKVICAVFFDLYIYV